MVMETAGRAVARLAVDRFRVETGQGTLVACGSGNNGGDGWVVARALHREGWPVWVTESAAPGEGIAASARADALADGVRVVDPSGPWPGVGLMVDALLGTGARGAPRGAIAELLDRLRELHLPVVAVDGPTGLDLATGVDHGAITATLTVTFGGPRRGHLLARDECGTIVVADVGLPQPPSDWPRLVTSAWAAGQLTPFPASAHKGTRGRVVIVGGAPGMTGAARLAARSAFAAGAGLVHVVAPAEAIGDLRTAEPDVQTLVHSFEAPLDTALVELLSRADAVVIGPGLGREEAGTEFVLALLAHARVVVLDADALMVLRGRRDELPRHFADRQVLCTPHVGEFRALFPSHAGAIEVDPWTAAAGASAESQGTILLKGVPTVIASPGGGMLTVAAGNPGLATGGSGDVLAGCIGALLAQGIALPTAAALGAQALGEAADHAARRVTARAMRPMDVVAALPEVWRLWDRVRIGGARAHDALAILPAPRTT
jgi:NAD(P)H-hydrate epimerase